MELDTESTNSYWLPGLAGLVILSSKGLELGSPETGCGSMERRPDDIFRVHDLSILKSPMPAHLIPNGSNQRTASSTSPNSSLVPARPTPKLNVSPIGLSALASSSIFKTPTPIGNKVGFSPLSSANTESVQASLESRLDVMNVGTEPALFQAMQNTPVQKSPLVTTRRHTTTEELKQLIIGDRVRKELGGGDEQESREKADAITTTPIESNLHVEQAIENQVECKVASRGDEIALSKWSLVVVSNNSSVTKLERSVTEDWIVLVGKRSDMQEMWHSSLITNRLSEREITTGSGRIYRLVGSCDDLAMIEAGFSFDLVEAFREGFPENWQMRLIQEFSVSTKNDGEHQYAGVEGFKRSSLLTKSRTLKTTKDTANSTVENDKERQNCLEVPKKERKAVLKRTSLDAEIKDDKVWTSEKKRAQGVSPKRVRRISEPISKWMDTPTLVQSGLEVRGRTRSGRRVITPLPYWENKYVRTFCVSPSSMNLRRESGQY